MNPMNWLSQFFGFFKAFQFWVVIAPWEAALRVRLGKRAVTLSPGIHWRIPFFDRIFVQSTRLRTIAEDGISVTSRDGKNLTVSVAINYAVKDIHRLFMSLASPDLTIISKVASRIAQVASESHSAELTPSFFESQIRESVSAEEYGLTSVSVTIMNFSFAKTYRLISQAYRTFSMSADIESAQPK